MVLVCLSAGASVGIDSLGFRGEDRNVRVNDAEGIEQRGVGGLDSVDELHLDQEVCHYVRCQTAGPAFDKSH